MAFRTFTTLCSQHPSSSKAFSLSQKKTPYPVSNPSSLPPSPDHESAFCLYGFADPGFLHRILLEVTFCICLLPLSVFSKFIRVVACTSISDVLAFHAIFSSKRSSSFSGFPSGSAPSA